MDLRLGAPSRARIIPRPGEGLRSAIYQAMDQAKVQAKVRAKDQAPRAEAAAARCVERTRPLWTWLALEWRRLGTVAAVVLILGVLLHAMYGANGMVVYRQKRAEMQALQREVDRLQKENNQQAEQIHALKSDPAAIEKEAREQLRYTRPGEFVLVSPDPPQKPPTGRVQNDNKTKR
ncbi:MAG: septum formation initiator family protein [Terriglobales bacterium]|jgi:cell division protein FtsB